MVIYGVALLAFCSVTGLLIGEALGAILGVKANVGGVGFAMLLLIYLTDRLKHAGVFPVVSASGVTFWSSMYIPIVVAMAAQQNVLGAVKGGPMVFLAGAIGVVLSFLMVPLLARLGKVPTDTSRSASSKPEVRA